MYLYSSNTCPKGVAARQWLQSRQIEFAEINLDQINDSAVEHRLRLLIREQQHDDSANLALPALTRSVNNQEQLLTLGFASQTWEDVVQARMA